MGMALDRSRIWANFSSKEAVAPSTPSFFSSLRVWLLYTPMPKSLRTWKPSSLARRTPSRVPARASCTPSSLTAFSCCSSWGSSRSQQMRGSWTDTATPAS